MITTIEESWLDYRREVLVDSDPYGPEFAALARSIFYAGAVAVMDLQSQGVTSKALLHELISRTSSL